MSHFFKFQIIYLTPLYQCWMWPSFVVKNLKLCEQHWFWWGKRFFRWKIEFLFFLKVLSKIVGYWYFFNILLQITKWYCNVWWCTVCFIFNQFQITEVIIWIIPHIQHQNVLFLKVSFNFTKKNTKKLSLIF